MGSLSAEFRQRCAADALADVAAYYAEVAAYLNHIAGMRFPNRLAVVVEKVRDLGYGENPQQQAAFYRETTHRSGSLADAFQIQGDQPTFNDLLDLDAAYRIATDFTAPTCCIVKQGNPVGPGLQRPTCRRLPEGTRGRPGLRVRRGRGVQPRDRRGDRRRA